MKKENEIRSVILLNKPSGITPLDSIRLFQEKFPLYLERTLSYAGRLDPMADGLLLILEGDENKKRKQYEHLEKTYTFVILVGISTDSYDVMGKITKSQPIQKDFLHKMTESIPSLSGEITLHYPPFSSKRIGGKPLFWYARNNSLSTIIHPEQTVTIHALEIIKTYSTEKLVIQKSIEDRIQLVRGEFRQKEILNDWDMFFSNAEMPENFLCIECMTRVSSGTYVRGLVHQLEQIVNVPLLTFSITRTKIGPYSLEDALKIV